MRLARRRGQRAVRTRCEAVDLFAGLGVPDAGDLSPEDLRTAYRRLAREHHPDLNLDRQEEATRIFADLNSANEILSGRAGEQRQAWEEEAWGGGAAGAAAGPPQPAGAVYFDLAGQQRYDVPQNVAQSVYRIQAGMGRRTDWRTFRDWAEAAGLEEMFRQMSQMFGGAEVLAGEPPRRRLRGRRGRRAKAPRWLTPPPVDCRWIPTTHPPSRAGDYLGYLPQLDVQDRVWVVRYKDGKWNDDEQLRVTHWTRLPGKPVSGRRAKEEKQASITPRNIEAFRRAYKRAKGETFVFEGATVLKAYAKYVLEYFDSILPPSGQRSIAANPLRSMESKVDALRRGIASTDLSWNPGLERKLKKILHEGESTISKLHQAELEHRLYGTRAVAIPNTRKIAKTLSELSHASLLFDASEGLSTMVLPALANRRGGRRARRGPRSASESRGHQQLIVEIFTALTAQSERASVRAMEAAQVLISKYGFTKADVDAAQQAADFLIMVESLKTEGKTLEDLMREGVILPTSAGPMGEANKATPLTTINAIIISRTKYGYRSWPISNWRKVTILTWFNSSASWGIVSNDFKTALRRSQSNKKQISLDANMIVVPFSARTVRPLLSKLKPLPLYTKSLEGRIRGQANGRNPRYGSSRFGSDPSSMVEQTESKRMVDDLLDWAYGNSGYGGYGGSEQDDIDTVLWNIVACVSSVLPRKAKEGWYKKAEKATLSELTGQLDPDSRAVERLIRLVWGSMTPAQCREAFKKCMPAEGQPNKRKKRGEAAVLLDAGRDMLGRRGSRFAVVERAGANTSSPHIIEVGSRRALEKKYGKGLAVFSLPLVAMHTINDRGWPTHPGPKHVRRAKHLADVQASRQGAFDKWDRERRRTSK